jgi:hypothetical protein
MSFTLPIDTLNLHSSLFVPRPDIGYRFCTSDLKAWLYIKIPWELLKVQTITHTNLRVETQVHVFLKIPTVLLNLTIHGSGTYI